LPSSKCYFSLAFMRSGIFVALLRGVNVGGNNMISMKSLKESFERLRFTQVSTYINSGNIIFTTKETDPRKLEKRIEQMLSKEYKLESKVVVRSYSELAKLVKSLPKSWDGNSSRRFNVMFLRHSIDSEKILEDIATTSDIEEVLYRPGTLLWSAEVSEINRTQMVKLASRKLYQEMTVRNLNTTKKLHELMKKLATEC